MAAVKRAREAHAFWEQAVQDYVATTDQNRMYVQAGHLAAATNSQQIMELIEKRDKAAVAANSADVALIELLRSEASLDDQL
jgi:hypothetical protein